MTKALQPAPKKSPQKRTNLPTSPPESRSRASLGLSAAASEGRLALQCCNGCGEIQYPPRDACHKCLSIELPWKDISPSGIILAETTIWTSPKLYFRERAPWRTGIVQLDVGPVVICHLHGDCTPNSRITLINRLDRSGQGVLIALPKERSPNMEDDPQLRILTNNPKYRRVMITDARNPNSIALAEAILEAGASEIFLGEAESWQPYKHQKYLKNIPNVTIFPLDVTDTTSVKKLAGEIAGKTDILINNANFVRPGGALDRVDTTFARDEIDVNYLGLLRLAQAFGPSMCNRTADGTNASAAWVNILSVHSLSNSPEYGCFSASNAAARSLAQNLRADFRHSGLRVMNIYCGPTEDEWYQCLPPPKVSHKTLSKCLIEGLMAGVEETYCGDVAKDIYERFRESPNVLEREMTLSGERA